MAVAGAVAESAPPPASALEALTSTPRLPSYESLISNKPAEPMNIKFDFDLSKLAGQAQGEDDA